MMVAMRQYARVYRADELPGGCSRCGNPTDLIDMGVDGIQGYGVFYLCMNCFAELASAMGLAAGGALRAENARLTEAVTELTANLKQAHREKNLSRSETESTVHQLRAQLAERDAALEALEPAALALQNLSLIEGALDGLVRARNLLRSGSRGDAAADAAADGGAVAGVPGVPGGLGEAAADRDGDADGKPAARRRRGGAAVEVPAGVDAAAAADGDGRDGAHDAGGDPGDRPVLDSTAEWLASIPVADD